MGTAAKGWNLLPSDIKFTLAYSETDGCGFLWRGLNDGGGTEYVAMDDSPIKTTV